MATKETGDEECVTRKTVAKNGADSKADIARIAQSMNKANKSQISQTLIIQAYCNSVAQQPSVNFEGDPKLKTLQESINSGLDRAKFHASDYLKVIQPEIIKNMSNIGNYFAIHNSVPTTLPPGSSESEWIEVLHTLQAQAVIYQRESRNTADLLEILFNNLKTDVDSFETIVKDLNLAVNGDEGVLESLSGRLSTIQIQINVAIAGLINSTVGIAGGILMICIGSITDFIIAGTTTGLIIGGIGILATSASGLIISGVSLANLNDSKASLLTKESELRAEVKLLTGIQSGYSSFSNQVKDAVLASLKMENAWKSLSAELETMITDLQNGIMSSGEIRQLFLNDANNDMKIVIEDINKIKVQMAGLTEIVAKKGQTVSEAIVALATANQESKPTMLLAEARPIEDSVADSTTTESVTKGINTANKDQVTQALIIQAYANSVNEQPMVDFSGMKQLSEYEKQINSGLKTAQTHANNYLNVIQPAIIANIANISNYYALHNAVATTLPKGSTEKQWIEVLTALESQAEAYQTDAKGVVNQLQTLYSELTKDAQNFYNVVIKLNAAVDGDNGALESISGQLSTIQTEINLAIVGIVLSGLAIAGGTFIAAVGYIAEFITAGTSTLLLFGGIALAGIGIAGGVSSAITLKYLNDEKANFLTQKSNLTAEVKLATGISSGYESLRNQIGNAVKAATKMSNAWQFLSADLGTMISDFKNGIKNTGDIRTIYLKTVNEAVKTVIKDTEIIKAQMVGVINIVAQKGQTVGEAILAAVERKQPTSTVTTLLLKDSKRFSSAAEAGVLSQTVENLNNAEDKIRSIASLPSAAQNIQSESLTNIPKIISQIHTLQDSVGSFINSAIPQLKDIETMLRSNRSLENIKTAIESLRREASALSTSAAQVLGAIQRTIKTINGYFSQLASIQASMTKQRMKLQGQLGNSKSQEGAAQKKYHYLFALGPLGFLGLAPALALYLLIMSEVEGYEGQISDLNTKISSLNSMNTVTGQLTTDFGNVIIAVSSVKNSVRFVSNDILVIKSDLNLGDIRTVIEIAVKAAITEVKTLSIDALGSIVVA